MHRSSTIYKQKPNPMQFLTNMLVDFDMKGQQGILFFLEEALL